MAQMTYLSFVARGILAALFLAAAWSKGRHFRQFVRTTREIGIPAPLAPPAAWGLIAYEVALGVSLLVGQAPIATAGAALLLVALFAGVSLRGVWSRRAIPCNCFGGSGTQLGYETLARAALLIVPIAGYYLGSRAGVSGWWPTTLETVVPSMGLVAAAILLGRWLLATPTVEALVRDRRGWEEADAQSDSASQARMALGGADGTQ